MKSDTRLEPYRPDAAKDYGYYSREIKLCWSRAVAGIVAMGYLLAEARMNLKPLEWRRLVAEECPFDLTVACRLMRIAADQRVTEPAIEAQLPPSWDKLYQLVTLPEPVFERGLADGVIRPTITGREIARLRASEAHEEGPGTEPVDRMAKLEAALGALLVAFPVVDSVTAHISDPKSQVIEIARRDLRRAA